MMGRKTRGDLHTRNFPGDVFCFCREFVDLRHSRTEQLTTQTPNADPITQVDSLSLLKTELCPAKSFCHPADDVVSSRDRRPY